MQTQPCAIPTFECWTFIQWRHRIRMERWMECIMRGMYPGQSNRWSVDTSKPYHDLNESSRFVWLLYASKRCFLGYFFRTCISPISKWQSSIICQLKCNWKWLGSPFSMLRFWSKCLHYVWLQFLKSLKSENVQQLWKSHNVIAKPFCVYF